MSARSQAAAEMLTTFTAGDRVRLLVEAALTSRPHTSYRLSGEDYLDIQPATLTKLRLGTVLRPLWTTPSRHRVVTVCWDDTAQLSYYVCVEHLELVKKKS